MLKKNVKLSTVIFATLVFCAGITVFTTMQKQKSEQTKVVEIVENTDDSDYNDECDYIPVIEVETKSSVIQHLFMPYVENEIDTEQAKENIENYTPEPETEAEPEPQMVIELIGEDYDNFLRIVEAEATGSDVAAKMMVANVIINRVKSPAFPSRVTDVIFQGNGEQFEPIRDGRFYTVTVTDSTVEAVNRALYGEDNSQGATFFATLYASRPGTWHAQNLEKLFEYGGHAYFGRR